MRRGLLTAPGFPRATRRLAKRHPEAAQLLREALAALAEDASQPALKSHKLKGDLAGFWACTVGYDLRIVFTLIPHEGAEAILLQTVGTHDEVY